MDLTQLKAQVMAMFAIKQSQGSQQSTDILYVLYTLILMTMIERVFHVAPQILDALWNHTSRYLAKQAVTASQLLPVSSEKTPQLSSITLRRSYETAGGKANTEIDASLEKVDGVLEYICSLDVAQHIKLDKRYILHNTEEIAVTPHIRAKITGMKHNETGEMINLEIVISSEKLGINDLRTWIDEIHRNYCFEKNNQLGGKKYYFNEVPVEPMQELMPHHGPIIHSAGDDSVASGSSVLKKKNYRWESAPKTLTFTMNEFHTSKSFRNVFGAHVAELKERLDLFVNHPDWYQARGIPHSLGILLHGIPGAGKTSTIKAIAKDTGRHIFNLSLRPYTTQKQLTHLFFNENVAVVGEDGVRQVYRIPLNQRVYVIEDIDCLTDIVYQRTNEAVVDPNGDAVTLSFLLNLLDGVLETPGRILIITTNHPEKLDRALVRPGRIDVNIRFEEATRELIKELYDNFYGKTVLELPAILEGVLTPAEVLECFCNHFKNPMGAIQQMVERAEQRQGTSLADLMDTVDAVDTFGSVSMSVSEITAPPASPASTTSSDSTASLTASPTSGTSATTSVLPTLNNQQSMTDFQYRPLDVTINPIEKYGDSGSHPKPHGYMEDEADMLKL